MSSEEIVFEAEAKMEKGVEFLHNEFRSIRTGQASGGLVENIRVDYYGSPTILKQLANISTPESSLIAIKPFDPSVIEAIEKAIQASPLGITPQNDGKVIRLVIPALSGERREQLVQSIKQYAEQSRVTVRNARRDANKHLEQAEKKKEISEDERDESKKEVDELTKKYIGLIDDDLKTKTAEVMEV